VHFDPQRAAAGAVTAAVGGLLLIGGCTSHHPAPLPSASAPVSAGPNAAAQLTAVAQLARGANYTGTYTADSSDSPPRSSVIIAFRTETRTRLDVTEADGHVLIQVDPTGTYTCNLPTSGVPSCLTLAGPGQSVPENLDPAGQALFTTTLDVLAQGANLNVAPEAPRAAADGIPMSTCYALIAAPSGGASPGTYCFTATGILTRAQFRSNVLQLTGLANAPVDSDFLLPATPLPVGTSASSPAGSGSPAGSPAASGAPAPSAAASS
jgi:hypothetical protein